MKKGLPVDERYELARSRGFTLIVLLLSALIAGLVFVNWG